MNSISVFFCLLFISLAAMMIPLNMAKEKIVAPIILPERGVLGVFGFGEEANSVAAGCFVEMLI
jgi:hypothetical protein